MEKLPEKLIRTGDQHQFLKRNENRTRVFIEELNLFNCINIKVAIKSSPKNSEKSCRAHYIAVAQQT